MSRVFVQGFSYRPGEVKPNPVTGEGRLLDESIQDDVSVLRGQGIDVTARRMPRIKNSDQARTMVVAKNVTEADEVAIKLKLPANGKVPKGAPGHERGSSNS